MNHVKQEHARGCGIACLAMLLGKTYQDTVVRFPNIDFEKQGIFVEHHLADHGWAMAKKYCWQPDEDYRSTRQQRQKWPDFFGNLHLCLVTVSEGAGCDHWILVEAENGQPKTIHDPMQAGPISSLPHYHAVLSIAAVVKI